MLKWSKSDGKDIWKNCIKKDPDKPGYYYSVLSHPKPDILESEVKWALGSTTVNKARGWDRISVQFSRAAMSYSSRPHELQHAMPPCSSPTPGVHPNSCPLSRWCHRAISSSAVPFSSCPQSLPASGCFPKSQLLAWGGQSIGVSASASVRPMNTQDWSTLGWTCWISLQSKGLQESSPTPQFKSINFSMLNFLHSPTLTSIHDH